MKQLLSFLLFLGLRLHAQWAPVPCPTSLTLNSLHFANEEVGYAGGNGVIVKTIDGGNTWSVQTTDCGIITSLHCSNKDTVFVAPGNYHTGVTMDGGGTWSTIPSQYSLQFSLITSVNPDFIYGVQSISIPSGTHSNPEEAYSRSNNFAATWNTNCCNNLPIYCRSIMFLDTITGYACGPNVYIYYNMTTIPGCIAKTIDGGRNWTRVQADGINWNCVYFTDYNTGYAVGDGGKICKITNGGGTWSMQYSGVVNNLQSVHFANPMVGCAVGSGGMILGTVDGGNNWVVQSSPTSNNLTGVFLTDSLNGVIIGNNGTILKTSNGPVGLKESALENPPQIFPNPVNGFLNVNVRETPSLFQIFDIFGREIINVNLGDLSSHVDLSFLSKGLYILKINNSKGSFTQKIIKE